MDAIAGSVQMTAGVRVAIMMEHGHNGVDRWWHVVKMNVGELEKAGWTWRLAKVNPLDQREIPHLEWHKAGEDYITLHNDRRAKRSGITLDDVVEILPDLLEDGPVSYSKAAEKSYEMLKDSHFNLTKSEVKRIMDDICSNPPEGYAAWSGNRGGKVLGIDGQKPESKQDKAKEIAMMNPGITAQALADAVGIRKADACTVIKEVRGSHVRFPPNFQSGNLGTPDDHVDGSQPRIPFRDARVGTGTVDAASLPVPGGES